MQKTPLSLLFGSLALATVALSSNTAQAGIEACGNIDVEANAECEVLFEGGCEAQCTPVSVTAACSVQLEAECNGECNLDAEVECTNTCQGSCEGQCNADPGGFDCEAECNIDCEGSCVAYADDNEARASCEATCAANCQADCEVVEPEANCEAQCNGCCGGSCTAEVNIDCQVDCQAALYGGCQAELEGGCKAECQKPEGALFCDGEYIDHGDNLAECVAALRALLDIEVEGYAEGSCSGNSCTGNAGGSISCSVDPEEKIDGSKLGWLAVLFGSGLLLGFRRRIS